MRKSITICVLLAAIMGGCSTTQSDTATIAITKISEDSTSTETTEATITSTSEIEETSEAVVAKNPLMPIITRIVDQIGEENLPYLEESTDTEFNKEYYLIDSENENYEETIIYRCPMSANMTEIIIVKTTDGHVEDAISVLEERRTKAIGQDAFYPEDLENAESSIVGNVGNYAYYVIAEKSTEIETTLIETLNSMETIS